MPFKVSSIVKSLAGNLLGGALGNSMPNNKMSQPQYAKLAKRLINKSPLEIENANVPPQTGHMNINPYEYGQVYYPETTSQLGEGHYMIFDIVVVDSGKFDTAIAGGQLQESLLGEETKGNFKEKLPSTVSKKHFAFGNKNRIESAKSLSGLGGQTRLRSVSSGISSTRPTHSTISDSIILYTPAQGLQQDYTVNYDMIESGLAGFLFERGLSSVVEGLSTATGEIVRGVTDTIAGALGAGGLRAVLDKSKAIAKNPKKEQVFKDVSFRPFNFKFEFAPRNKSELESAYKIIELFKYHMHPEIAPNRYFIVPSEFQITYMYREGVNAWFPKISRCVLTNMKVNYAPDNVVSTFKADERGAAPVIFDMELSFVETEIMTKQTIAQGF